MTAKSRASTQAQWWHKKRHFVYLCVPHCPGGFRLRFSVPGWPPGDQTGVGSPGLAALLRQRGSLAHSRLLGRRCRSGAAFPDPAPAPSAENNGGKGAHFGGTRPVKFGPLRQAHRLPDCGRLRDRCKPAGPHFHCASRAPYTGKSAPRWLRHRCTRERTPGKRLRAVRDQHPGSRPVTHRVSTRVIRR